MKVGVILETDRAEVIAFSDGLYKSRIDKLAVESSLTVVVNGSPRYCSMRMPGMDRELALGLCYSEGVICSVKDVISIEESDDSTVTIETHDSGSINSPDVKTIKSPEEIISNDEDSISASADRSGEIIFTPQVLFELQNDFCSRQKVFLDTGAVHGAGVYDKHCHLLSFAEDVGRHTALDKCIGHLLVAEKLHDAVYCILSSRLSCEMVIKSARAGINVLTGVSAPTSLAVKLAKNKGMTLIGFLRKERFNVYSGEYRIDLAL